MTGEKKAAEILTPFCICYVGSSTVGLGQVPASEWGDSLRVEDQACELQVFARRVASSGAGPPCESREEEEDCRRQAGPGHRSDRMQVRLRHPLLLSPHPFFSSALPLIRSKKWKRPEDCRETRPNDWKMKDENIV